MGWASGTEVADIIIETVKAEVKDDATRKRIYIGMIRALEHYDWDTQDECMGTDPMFDAALHQAHPDWDWD